MNVLHINLITLIIEAILATYVATRAWLYRPAKLFVGVTAAFMFLNFGAYLESARQSLQIANDLKIIGLTALDTTLLLMLSSLFVPQWWEKKRPIGWISLPYLLISSVVTIDLTGHYNILQSAISNKGEVYQTPNLSIIGTVVFYLFVVSWLVHLIILLIGFFQQPNLRTTIVTLTIIIMFDCLAGLFSDWLIAIFGENYNLIFIIPLLFALAYSITSGQLFEPTPAALDLALQAMSEAVAVINTSGELIYANASAKKLGMQPGQLLSYALDAAGLDKDKLNLVTSPSVQHLKIRATERTFEIAVSPVNDTQGRQHGKLLLGRDITELERHNNLLEQERMRLAQAVSQLGYIASHDSLTGLPNRRTLLEAIEHTIVEQSRESILLLLDLDNFKLVNDTLGHNAGDQILVILVELLNEQLGPDDLLARFGGDEFAILLHKVELNYAQALAHKLCAKVENFRFRVEEHSFELGVSIGLVKIDNQLNAQLTLAQADIAMYAAKEQGRNRVVVYDGREGSFNQLSDANRWVANIKDALQENRLVLQYQPVVRLADRSLAHYEALVRMKDRQGKLVPPAFFISAVEQFGLMPQLNRWIVRQAVSILRDNATTNVFMNLSGRSLGDLALMDFIELQLYENKIAAGRLGFEITESVAIQDADQAEKCIRRLKTLGCHFALDDFGIGFNSFAYLNSFSVDQIKIDGSFIRTLDKDPSNRAIVQAMHDLAEALDKETVAEYVQNEATIKILQEIGITYGQGYYFGRPGAIQTSGQPLKF